jgi:hypothetical protein
MLALTVGPVRVICGWRIKKRACHESGLNPCVRVVIGEAAQRTIQQRLVAAQLSDIQRIVDLALGQRPLPTTEQVPALQTKVLQQTGRLNIFVHVVVC